MTKTTSACVTAASNPLQWSKVLTEITIEYCCYLIFESMGDNLECPICTETYCETTLAPLKCFQKKRKLRQKTLSCCDQRICERCMYSHVRSIFEEGITGDGRKNLACPFGCGKDLTDAQVRSCIRAKHFNISWALLGYFFEVLIQFIRMALWFLWIPCSDDWILLGHKLKEYAKSAEEKRVIDLYCKWSLTVALSHPQHHEREVQEKYTPLINGKEDFGRHYVHVQHCPRPGCECLWLTSEPFREHKLKNERKYLTKVKQGSNSGSRYESSLYQSASEWLFYVPSKPTEENELHGDSTENWLTVSDLQFIEGVSSEQPLTRRNHEPIQYSDGRYVTCPSCHLNFCGLCFRPWEAFGKKRISHSKLTCCTFAHKTTTENDFINQAIDARLCPGCGILTNRSSGCNHITCRCGYEWCYVCECRWSSAHYTCVDGGYSSGCVIS